ncbi:LysR substrate-binding domain-containing protein [Streptomyces mexicanus]|uniref:LysR substrate-binding domain-containing protein n=1 Tax=Streptomyces mexicanus TaxID=178566 RepID=UPI0036A6D401
MGHAGDPGAYVRRTCRVPAGRPRGTGGRAAGAGRRGPFVGARETVLRIGTGRGMGERLERVLEALAGGSPGTRVELVSAMPAERLRRIAAGEWDAAFVRGVLEAAEGVRQVPVWRDELVVALPAGHPAPRADTVDLSALADLPLCLTGRRNNPLVVDLVETACADAGFAPVPGPPTARCRTPWRRWRREPTGWTVAYTAAAHRADRLPAGGRRGALPAHREGRARVRDRAAATRPSLVSHRGDRT